MPATRLDGANDNILFNGGAVDLSAAGARTFMYIVRFASGTPGAWQAGIGLETSTSLVVSHFERNASNQLNYSNQAQGTDSSVATSTGVDVTSYFMLVCSKPAGTGAPTFYLANLSTGGAGAAFANSTGTGISNYTSAADRIIIGEWNGNDDLSGWIVAAAIWNRALSTTDVATLNTNLKTSDIYTLASGAPAALWEFNAASSTDLMGGGASEISRSGTSLDAAETPPWTFDGIGTLPPATAAGQYGWGTYGKGDYGPGFGADLSTPISASEAHAMSEGATVIQVSMSRVDNWSWSEPTPSLANALAALESYTFADSPASVAQSVAVSASDSGALAEAATVLATMAIVASDSWALTDASSVLQTLALSGTETFSMLDSSLIAAATAASEGATQTENTPGLEAQLSRVDSWAFTDVAAVATQLSISVSDAWALAEAANVLTVNLINASDSGALTDAVAVLSAAVGASEALTMAELAALAVQTTASDSATHSDGSATLANALASVDSWLLSEAALAASTNLVNVSDSLALSESSSIAATLAALDVLTHTDAPASIAVALSATDPATLAEAAALANTLGVNDQFVLTDSGAVNRTQFMVASDAFTMDDQAVVQTAVPAPNYKLPTTANIAVWAASAVLAERWSKINTIAAPTSTATLAGIVSKVTLSEISYTATIATPATTATLVS